MGDKVLLAIKEFDRMPQSESEKSIKVEEITCGEGTNKLRVKEASGTMTIGGTDFEWKFERDEYWAHIIITVEGTNIDSYMPPIINPSQMEKEISNASGNLYSIIIDQVLDFKYKNETEEVIKTIKENK